MPKDYLGDNVFAEVEDGKIKLTNYNVADPQVIPQTIYLEPEVYHRLVAFVESIQVVPHETNQIRLDDLPRPRL